MSRVFLTGGYDAGSLMLQMKKEHGRFLVQPVFRLDPKIFGAAQHTPILLGDHLYGVRADGKFVCLSLDGKVVWTQVQTGVNDGKWIEVQQKGNNGSWTPFTGSEEVVISGQTNLSNGVKVETVKAAE